MSNRWADGFGRYGGTSAYMLNGSSSQAWAQVDNKFSLSSANPRTGNWHLRKASGNDAAWNVARRVFGAPMTEVLLGYAIYCHSLPTAESTGGTQGGQNGTILFGFHDQANNHQFRVLLGTDGAIEVRRGLEVIDRSLPVIGAGAYQHLECYAKAGNGDGAFEIRVDEVTRLNLTGIDNVQTANLEFSQVIVGQEFTSIGASPMIDYADFFCNDTTDDGSGCNTFVGDCKSGWLPVNADTAQADFDLSSGAQGYPLLAETPPADGTYIFTDATAAESHFGLTDGPANLVEILTARPALRAWKDDAGTCTIAPSMVSSGDKAAVSAQPVATAPAYYDSNVPFDPDTGVPWTPSGLAAALLAAERVS